MPAIEEVKSSWADEVEETSEDLPQSTEIRDNGLKVVTEYRRNEDGKKEKIVRTYKTEKRLVSKSIALRKTWKKYGESANDKPGPDPATTVSSEETFMQFITCKEDQDKPEEDVLDKLKGMTDKTIKCRTCNGDHWTQKCPFKDTSLGPSRAAAAAAAVDEKKPGMGFDDKNKPSKYVIPSKRNESLGGSSIGGGQRPRDESCAVRLSNLSESTQEVDLDDLVRPFGEYTKLFLSKDKVTGMCKGFAYIHFKTRQAANMAIQQLDGHGYDHLILSAEWSKPQPQNH